MFELHLTTFKSNANYLYISMEFFGICNWFDNLRKTIFLPPHKLLFALPNPITVSLSAHTYI